MSTKNEIKIVRKRFKCPKCRIIESHSLGSSKTSCSKCGSPFIEISEKEYQQIKLKQKKNLIEDIKETDNTEKKKKKSSHKNITNEESDSEQKEKKKSKFKRNLSQREIKDKEFKELKSRKYEEESEDVEDDKKSSKKSTKPKTKKGKKKNRNKSVKDIGNYINNIVSNVLGNLGIDGIGKINFDNLQDIDGSTIIINQNNSSPMQIVVNNQNVSSDVFDPIFSQFGSIFNDNFINNFSSNFASNFNGNFFDQVQSIIENNQQENEKHSHGPTEDKSLNKLKRFQLTNKYCKKGKNGKIELPNCCICLSEIAKGQETVLLPCGHMFHWKCCLNWLKKNNTCPMCRFEIK
jgi:hypothetical protein